MPRRAYRLALSADHPYVRASVDVEFRVRFMDGERVRSSVQGSEWVVAPGGVVSTDDPEAQRIIAGITDGDGALMFAPGVSGAGSLDLELTFDRHRSEKGVR